MQFSKALKRGTINITPKVKTEYSKDNEKETGGTTVIALLSLPRWDLMTLISLGFITMELGETPTLKIIHQSTSRGLVNTTVKCSHSTKRVQKQKNL